MKQTGLPFPQRAWTPCLIAVACVALLQAPAGAASDSEHGASVSDAAPKMVAGIVSAVLSNVVAAGAQAMLNRVFPSTSDVAAGRSSPCYAAVPRPASVSQAVRDELVRSGCMLVGQSIQQAAQVAQGRLNSIVTTDQPLLTPLIQTASGAFNYQGIRVSALIVDDRGQVLEERSLGQPFYAGEKIKLKIQSTYSGALEVQHQAPSGRVKQLFPKAGVDQVLLVAGAEMVLPLGHSAYEFSGDTGVERLRLTVREQGGSPHAASAPVYRQDTPGQSFYAVEANGGSAIVSQEISIAHRQR
ncbi:DUF4384 domain-containing protein [Aquabacterium lacunae]|uniref:DUF4384 domain-containing protein n=1 Tax=Aquabacterium lacunae TaxID=2528630 RepID=A0A4Q9H434_9BURK|nr:DUF4384 domain-containing protein [Aquabacterium lacunae]TBO31276.1 DUF4384 domain-containing protein [Aquabacterium lacunae]